LLCALFLYQKLAANYNHIAPLYDRLSRLVYGNTLMEAQRYLLRQIAPNSQVLIAGGGTGAILEQLPAMQLSGLQITFVEPASKMLAFAQLRKYGHNSVRFICSTMEDAALEQQFDYIITPFLFDNFGQETLTRVFNSLHQALLPGGTWLHCDFEHTGKPMHKLLLRAMYLFFRVSCGIEARSLPDLPQLFAENQYYAVQKAEFYSGFIVAIAYQSALVQQKTTPATQKLRHNR